MDEGMQGVVRRAAFYWGKDVENVQLGREG